MPAAPTLPPRLYVRGIRDVEEIERVPLAERNLFDNVYEAVLAAAREYGDAPAQTFLPGGGDASPVETLSFRQLADRVTRIARVLLAVTGRQLTTGLLLPQGPWAMPAMWGAQAAGVANPVNPWLAPDQLRGLLAAAGTEALVVPSYRTDPELHRTLAGVAAGLPLLRAVLTVDVLPTPGAPAVPDDRPAPAWPVPVRSLEEAATGADSGELPSAGPHDRCAVFHTGGTTGRPKLVPHTHRNELFTAWAMGLATDVEPGETLLSGLPLFHVNAVHVTGLTPLLGGAHVVVLSPLGFRDVGLLGGFWKIVERYRPTTFSAVPTVLSVLTQVPVDADVSSLRFVYCGAAPLPDAVRDTFAEHTGVRVLQGYGLSEGTCTSTVTPSEPDAGRHADELRSVGLRLPYQQLRIVDADGQDVGDGRPGRVQVRGPNVFPGYLDPPGTGVGADGWLDTGDLGTVREGWLSLGGRAKDVIIRGGHNIDPAVIEDALLAHPDVLLVAAVGRPDTHSGEVPVAYVQLLSGAGQDAAPELLRWAQENVGERAAVPKEVVVVDALPLTLIGKVSKPPLRQDAALRAAATALDDLFPATTLTVTTDTAGVIHIGVLADAAAADTVRARLAALPVRVDVTAR